MISVKNLDGKEGNTSNVLPSVLFTQSTFPHINKLPIKKNAFILIARLVILNSCLPDRLVFQDDEI